mgnify:CR=1 FL=1
MTPPAVREEARRRDARPDERRPGAAPVRPVASLREDLALAFRLAERFGFHEGICNHFSVRVGDGPGRDAGAGPDGGAERYLINPYGLHWSVMTADALLLIDGDGRVLEGHGEVEDTARFIHVAGHRANPRHTVLLHTHMPWATVLTMLDGDAGTLRMAHQTACRFHGRIDHEPEFGGLAHDDAEGERLARRAAARADVDVVMLANHGVVVGGSSVATAFDDLYYLERACRQQVLAMQTGAPLRTLPDAVVAETARQFVRDLDANAERHFRALGDVLVHSPDRAFTF